MAADASRLVSWQGSLLEVVQCLKPTYEGDSSDTRASQRDAKVSYKDRDAICASIWEQSCYELDRYAGSTELRSWSVLR